jgi:hypothetical protein
MQAPYQAGHAHRARSGALCLPLVLALAVGGLLMVRDLSHPEPRPTGLEAAQGAQGGRRPTGGAGVCGRAPAGCCWRAGCPKKQRPGVMPGIS